MLFLYNGIHTMLSRQCLIINWQAFIQYLLLSDCKWRH